MIIIYVVNAVTHWLFFILIYPLHIIILTLNLLNDLNPKAILFIILIKLLFPSM